ncbi:hypothetical protein ACFL5H_03375 [Candidatus Latescibacterota bacterium]
MDKNPSLSLIGFFQALGLIVYCSFIAGLFWLADTYLKAPPQFLAFFIFLLLFVFSAAVTGSIVFAFPVYLTLNQRISEALTVFFYTLLYCLIIILLAVGLVAVMI